MVTTEKDDDGIPVPPMPGPCRSCGTPFVEVRCDQTAAVIVAALRMLPPAYQVAAVRKAAEAVGVIWPDNACCGPASNQG